MGEIPERGLFPSCEEAGILGALPGILGSLTAFEVIREIVKFGEGATTLAIGKALEEMLADPPELILAAATPGEGENRLLTHPALAALRDTRRERFDPALLWCGGPTIVRAAQRLAQIRRGQT